MNKKRVLAMLLAGAMALSMTACGGGNSASTDGSSNDGGASASGGSYKVSVILKTLAAEYWQYVKSGAEDYASEHSDKVTVEVKGPSSETAFDEMQNMIETDLSSGTYDGIVISPLQSDTAAQLVSGTKLPIVAIDTNFTAPEVKSFVGTGNEAAAKKGGEAAVEAAKAAGWTDIKCIEIAGVQGDQTNTANAWGDWDPKEYTVEDSAFGFITMENGATIVLESSWALNTLDVEEAATTLCGVLGGADMKNAEGKPGGARINGVKHGRQFVEIPDLHAGGVAFYDGASEDPAEIEQIIYYNAITKGTELCVKPEQAFVVTQILEAIYESAKTGKPVYLD